MSLTETQKEDEVRSRIERELDLREAYIDNHRAGRNDCLL
jgi:hypothetical protein